MTKLGDKKTIYSYAEDYIQEYETTCVGFTPDKSPVWHCKVTSWNNGLDRRELYIVFDKIGTSLGFHATVEEALEHMRNLADLRDVMNEHLRINVDVAEARWREKEEKEDA